MNINQYSVVDLVHKIIYLSGRVSLYPSNLLYPRQLDSALRELGKRLDLSKDEMSELLKGR